MTKASFSLTAPVHRGLGSQVAPLPRNQTKGQPSRRTLPDPEAEGKGEGSITQGPHPAVTPTRPFHSHFILQSKSCGHTVVLGMGRAAHECPERGKREYL